MRHKITCSHAVICGVLLTIASVESSYDNVKIKNNGYSGVVVAINTKIKEDSTLIDAIKNIFNEASISLYDATRKRAFFKNVTILVPKSWKKGNYGNAEKEAYAAADVLIRGDNKAEDNTPFTLQYKGCGKPGQYIHMTPEFVRGGSNITRLYGPLGKALVHEWAHLRWGVFDETNYNANFKFYLEEGSVEANRCPKGLDGIPVSISKTSVDNCEIHPDTFLPEESCVFLANKTQNSNLTSSLMSHSYLSQVVTFCHNDISDEINLHNQDAPNEQNLFCDKKSTWEIIMESPDFDNTNHPNTFLNTTPNFKVVRTQAERFVLVLDVSGSMNGAKLEAMRQVADAFIRDFVAKGSYVGLVKFGHFGTILSKLLKINKTSINELTKLIPNNAGGGTGIGDGILKGIEVLESRDSAGSNLFVLTDGHENQSPYVSDVYSDVTNKGVKMHTVFFDTQANDIMKNLSIESGGRWYFSQSSDPTAILEDFFTISQTSNENVKTLLIHSESVNVQANVEFNDSVSIDKSVGNNTVFTFSWKNGFDSPLIRIRNSKEKCFYANYNDSSLLLCNDTFTYEINQDIKTIRFNINGKAKNGRWRFFILAINNEEITSSVTSQSLLDGEDPIEVEAWIEETDVVNKPALIYAKVSKGSKPVIKATVKATITDPVGDKTKYRMKDNGKGDDIRMHDGLYVKTFTSYKHQGRYSLKVTAEGGQVYSTVNSNAPINTGTVNWNGAVDINQIPSKEFQPIEDYTRILTGGGFQYTGDIDTDNIPPGKITDLSVSQVDLRNYTFGINVTFSAPGDDAYDGTASRYELRYTVGDNTNDIINNGGTLVSTVLEGNLNSPKKSDSEENFVILLNQTDITIDDTSLKLLFNVKAVDHSGLYSDASNIASLTYFLKNEALPKIRKYIPDATTTKPTDALSTFSVTSGPVVQTQQTTNEFVHTDRTKEEFNIYKVMMWVFVATTTASLLVVVGLIFCICQIRRKSVKSPTTAASEINAYI